MKDDDQRYSGKIPVREECLGVLCKINKALKKVGETVKTLGETVKPVLETMKIAAPIIAAAGG